MSPILGDSNIVPNPQKNIDSIEKARYIFSDIQKQEAIYSIEAILEKFPTLKDEILEALVSKPDREEAPEEETEVLLHNKLTEITLSVGEKPARWFQKAWDLTRTYTPSSKKKEIQEKLLHVTYHKTAEGGIGIVGIPGFDRQNKVFGCEYTNPVVVKKYLLSKEIFPQGAGIKKGFNFPDESLEKNKKKGSVLKFVNKEKFGNIDFIDWEESHLVDIDVEQRAQFFAKKREIYQLLHRADGDGRLLEALMNLGMPFKTHVTFWLADESVSDFYESFCVLKEGLCGPEQHYGSEYCPIRGFHNYG